jgi:High potential iron-sulfur protein
MKVNKHEINDTEMPANNTRRALLQLALMSIPVVMALNSRKVLADEEGDVTKIKFHYQDHPNGSMKCAQCVYFVPPAPNGLTGVCRIIDGDVTANSWCTAFRPA